jgi:hypothetical protein
MLNAQLSDPNRSRRVRCATVERKTRGQAQTPGTQGAPATKQAPNSDPGGEVDVVSVSISVYGHPAWGSLGAGEYKAHEQVS